MVDILASKLLKRKIIKKFLLVFISFFISSFAYASNNQIIQAYKNHKSDLQVKGYGKIIKILRDDTKGSKHQRFILKISNKITVLIAHNIDLAKRVRNIRVGDKITFYGEYEWNKKGGVIHWTHHDPRARHTNGWLKHNGKTYQ